jgi:phospholipase D1/2
MSGIMGPILKEGKNCWRIRNASRVAFLVDGAAYFDAFARSAASATESILIAGWDIDSRIRLFSQEERGGLPSRLREFMKEVVRRRKTLHVHILEWDFAVIYAFERELFPIFSRPWRETKKIHFHLDSKHPVGGSHHQKVVVIDDRIAFVGGIDLTRRRWDTPEHAAADPRRVDPSGEVYGPFHDVQIAVSGEAAETLGDLVRARWQRATGERLQPPGRGGVDPWPASVSPDLENVPVAVARTDPLADGGEGVREVEALYLDTIGSAQRFIYVENQYLSSFSVGRALTASLMKEEGPEIVIVLRAGSDWLEETTMGVFRAKLLASLRKADVHGRLGVYHPEVPNLDGKVINIHSKLMLADGTFVRVGSSNLSNRSMGVDTECDIALESSGEKRIEKGIVNLLNRLLGEHLGVSALEVERTIAEEGSLIRCIERLRGSKRTLLPFPEEAVSWTTELIPESAIDPVEPIDPEKLLEEFVPEGVARKSGHCLHRFILLLLAMLGLAAAWRWTPLGEWIAWDTLVAMGDRVRDNGAAPVIVLSAYIIGSLFMFPVTVMIMVTAFTFGPASGFLYSLVGSLLAAIAGYGLGRELGRDTVSRWSGARVNRLSRRLGRHGVITVGTVRLLPIAPFTVVNLVAGASHIRFWDFVFGTIFGMAPGIAAITLFEHQLGAAIREPGLESFALLAVLAAAIIAAILGLRAKLFVKREKPVRNRDESSGMSKSD